MPVVLPHPLIKGAELVACSTAKESGDDEDPAKVLRAGTDLLLFLQVLRVELEDAGSARG
jgi:hypothetical protein